MYNKVQPPLMATTGTQKAGGKSPHCKVCGDESSGFHYGVDSCEGCKGFFRRCITQGMTHKCANEEKCEITPFTRNSCQYCRLKKCFSVGMSREASRLGRRPKRLKDVSGDSQRSHQVNLPIAPYPSPAELYRLRMAELQKLLQANGTFKSELMQAFLSAAQASFREHAKNSTTGSTSTTNTTHTTLDGNQNTYTQGMIPFGNESGYSSMSSPASSKSQSPLHDNNHPQMLNNNQMMDNTNMNTMPPTTTYNANTTLGLQQQQQQQQQQHQQQQQQHPLGMTNTQIGHNSMPSTHVSNISSPMSSTTLPNTPSPLSTSSNLNAPVPMPYIMPQDCPVTIKTEPTSTGACDFPDSNGNQAMEVLRMLDEAKQTPVGSRRQLIQQVQEAVTTAHLSTSLNTIKSVQDANERLRNSTMPIQMPDMSKLSLSADSMWQGFLSQMVPEITNVVKFCKKLPGFTEIEQEDQIKLLKQGSFEVMMTRFTMLVDVETEEMLDPSHKMKCPKQVIMSMPMGNFFQEFFKVAGELNPLNLTDSEIGLFSACLIMCPDRLGLKNVKALNKIQNLFQQSLYMMLEQNHSEPDTLFLKLLTSVPVLRTINEEHSKAINNIKMTQPGTYEEVFPALHQEVFDGKL